MAKKKLYCILFSCFKGVEQRNLNSIEHDLFPCHYCMASFLTIFSPRNDERTAAVDHGYLRVITVSSSNKVANGTSITST